MVAPHLGRPSVDKESAHRGSSVRTRPLAATPTSLHVVIGRLSGIKPLPYLTINPSLIKKCHGAKACVSRRRGVLLIQHEQFMHQRRSASPMSRHEHRISFKNRVFNRASITQVLNQTQHIVERGKDAHAESQVQSAGETRKPFWASIDHHCPMRIPCQNRGARRGYLFTLSAAAVVDGVC